MEEFKKFLIANGVLEEYLQNSSSSSFSSKPFRSNSLIAGAFIWTRPEWAELSRKWQKLGVDNTTNATWQELFAYLKENKTHEQKALAFARELRGRV